MENKKRYLIGFLTSLFSIQFISAPSSLDYDLSRFTDIVGGVFGFIVGDVYNSELLLVKALVFLLLLAIINSILKKTNMFEPRITAVVSIIVSLLSIRFITTEALINFIWMPYGGLGVLLASFFPFIIYFFFLENFDSRVIRKVGWVAFIFVYLLMGYTRYTDLRVGDLWWQNYALIYVAIAIVSFLVFIFDKTIQRTIIMNAIEEGYTTNNILLRTDLQKRMERLQESLSYASKSEVSKIQERIDRIKKQIRSMS